MTERDRRSSGFVADGHDRAGCALRALIRAEVEAEFADRLRGAPAWKRYWIRRKIEREIERGIAAAAPPDALY